MNSIEVRNHYSNKIVLVRVSVHVNLRNERALLKYPFKFFRSNVLPLLQLEDIFSAVNNLNGAIWQNCANISRE